MTSLLTSTFIARLTDPVSLSEADRDAVMTALSVPVEEQDMWDGKVAIEPVIAIAQEIMSGRLEAVGTMNGWLTPAEMVDANMLIAKVVDGTWTLFEVRNILIAGERGHYTPQEIEDILLPAP